METIPLEIEKKFNTIGAPPAAILKNFPKIEYKIKGENNELYNFTISQGENSIIFLVTEVGEMPKVFYKNESSLQDIFNSNRIFRQYISLEEMFNIYFKSLKESEVIIRKDNNKIKVCFLIEFRDKKDEVPFILKPEKSNIEDIVINLCEKIKEIDLLKKEIKEQKSLNEKIQKEFDIYKQNIEDKINNILKNYNSNKNNIDNKFKDYDMFNSRITGLESKLNDKENIINNLINKINLLEKDVQELKKKNNELEFVKKKLNEKEEIDSNIIKKNELCLIEEGIKNKFNKNIKQYELLLRGSRDGFDVKTFHSKCDNKSYTLSLVETNEGRRFGGFTDITWDQSKSWKKSNTSFIFSLDNKEIYYNKSGKNSIYCYESKNPNGLAFGEGHDFKLYDNCNLNNESYDESGSSFETNGKKYALAGQHNFSVKDYEVYKIYLE